MYIFLRFIDNATSGIASVIYGHLLVLKNIIKHHVFGTGPVTVLMVKMQTKATYLDMMVKLLSALGWEVESSIAYDDDHRHHHTSQHLLSGKPSPIPDCVQD